MERRIAGVMRNGARSLQQAKRHCDGDGQTARWERSTSSPLSGDPARTSRCIDPRSANSGDAFDHEIEDDRTPGVRWPATGRQTSPSCRCDVEWQRDAKPVEIHEASGRGVDSTGGLRSSLSTV
jgi:hypothetical protein